MRKNVSGCLGHNQENFGKRRRSRRALAGRRVRAVAIAVETLEPRYLFSALSQQAHTTFVLDNSGGGLAAPFTPAEVRQAYNINQVSFGNIAGSGAGQTIAIIDAENDPDITSDIGTFDSTFGLQPMNVLGGPTFKVENQDGLTTGLPDNETPGTWDIEESLDVEWAHSVAPMANIILFEANTPTFNDLLIAENTARNTPGVSVVSMSFGAGEFSQEPELDSFFTTPAGHQGVTFVASTGDVGGITEYPSVSPNVLAVGGTTLTINSDGSYGGESAWSDGGGGVSAYEPQPTFQNGVVSSFSTTKRTVPDISWLADPNSGVFVLDTFDAQGGSGWFQVGGTSLAAPMWSGLISIVNQGRAIEGLSSLDGPTQTLPDIYSLPASAFNDITTGSNGFAAGPGYDLATGLGTPNLPALVSDLDPAATTATAFYVDASASGLVHDGSSWADAFNNLQSALSAAQSVETASPGTPISIFVAQGTYTPSQVDPTATFGLMDDVSIYGGYAGGSSGNPGIRNVAAFRTTLSGDGVDYHVVTGSGTNSTAVLDGVTISGGNAKGGGDSNSGIGGGILNIDGSPTLNDLNFTGDTSSVAGGAMADNGGSPVLTSCTFSGDTSADGGAIYDAAGSAPYLSNCTISGDSASVAGGAMFDNASSPKLLDCTVSGNSAASGGGGGMYESNGSAATLTNCLFTSNTSSGGGAVFANDSDPAFVNCDFTANNSGNGGAFYLFNDSAPTITNCILWSDSAINGGEIDNDGTSTPAVTFSDVQGGIAGTGNVNANPLFTNASGGNYQLSEYSPCINSGSNAALPAGVATDLAGRPRVVSGVVDMGAFEYQITYVDAGATGLDNGSSWANGFTTLQQALNVAVVGQTIEVSQGTYTTSGTGGTFELVDGVALLGGYDGAGASNPDARVVGTSILSGGNVSYHVVTSDTLDYATVLDGFTISGGRANGGGAGQKDGGGLFINQGSLTINNCTFSGDTASFGGGIYSYVGSPNLTACTFTGDTTSSTNTALWAYYATMSLTNTTFSSNSGVGLYNEDADVTLTNCIFSKNAQGLHNVSTIGTLVDCLFNNNTNTGGDGGGIYDSESSPVITNCTFTANSASQGGAIYNINSASPQLINCIVYDDSASQGSEIRDMSSSNPSVTYSDIKGGFTGTGNINSNPLFAGSSNFQLTLHSPCINAGLNSAIESTGATTDLAGNPRIIGGTVDMGAYEYFLAPSITSNNSATFETGQTGSFTFTTAAFPTPSLAESNPLPTGVSFHDNGNGTATLFGTPAAGTGGVYLVTIAATNGISPAATQTFTLTVDQTPAITTANNATFSVGTLGSFAVATTGFPAAAVSETGTLPAGVSLTGNGNGTATFSGTPQPGTGGTYLVTLTAANGVSPNAIQTFTLTVDQAAAITSTAGATFTVGSAGSFNITTMGFPIAAVSEIGGLPAGVTFTNDGNGTATLTGTPNLSTGGTYLLTLTAANGISPSAMQTFTLTVDQAPAITSGDYKALTVGVAGAITITTSGFPTNPAFSETGALPTGITFTDNGDGTASVAGTAASGTTGLYVLTLTANNGVSPIATQVFTIAVTSTNAVVWTADGDGVSWNDPNNWSDIAVPTSSNDAFIPPGFGTVQVPSGSFTVHSLMAASPLQVDAGATVALLAPSAISSALTIQSSGAIDLTTGGLAFDYGVGNTSPLMAVQGYLGSGAIFSSVVAANPQDALGYADGSADNGTAALPGQVLIRYTLDGDANLDGQVNSSDLLAVIQNFNLSGTDWAHGNFTDGSETDSADLLVIIQNFNKTLNPPATSAAEQSGGSTLSIGQSASAQALNQPKAVVASDQYATTATPPPAAGDPVGDLLQADAGANTILAS